MTVEALSAYLMWSYCVINVGAFLIDDLKKAKATFAFANGLLTLGAILGGNLGIAALCASVASRQLVSVFTFELTNQQRLFACLFFVVSTTYLICMDWNGALTLLLVANGIWSTVFFFYAKGFWFNFGLVVSCALWMANGFLAGEASIVIASLPGLLISLFKVWGHRTAPVLLKTN